MDDLCILKIASYLSKTDLISFTHACTRHYNLISFENSIWKNELQRQGYSLSPVIHDRAARSPIFGCEWKKLFFACTKISINMRFGHYTEIGSQDTVYGEPAVVDGNIFWIDWPALRNCEKENRLAAILNPTLVIYEYNGISKVITPFEVGIPEPFSNGIAVIGDFSIDVDCHERVAILGVDEPDLPIDDDGNEIYPEQQVLLLIFFTKQPQAIFNSFCHSQFFFWKFSAPFCPRGLCLRKPYLALLPRPAHLHVTSYLNALKRKKNSCDT